MSFRYFIPGILWLVPTGLMLLPPQYSTGSLFFGSVPSVSFLHGILLLGLVHIWIGACKKQLKYSLLRRRAIYLVYGSAILISILTEASSFLYGVHFKYCIWNLLFDIIGASLGILTFKLLYRKCY